MRKTMPWLLAATALILAGAGCEGSLTTNTQNQPPTNVDGAIKVYLKGSANDQAAATAENADEAQLNSTDASLNAYANAYDAVSL